MQFGLTKIGLAGLLLSFAVVAQSQAVEINFEKDQGYVIADEQGHGGNLSGQPTTGTMWSKTKANEIRIMADASGNQVAQVPTGGNGMFYKFNPTDNDLGGASSIRQAPRWLSAWMNWRPIPGVSADDAPTTYR